VWNKGVLLWRPIRRNSWFVSSWSLFQCRDWWPEKSTGDWYWNLLGHRLAQNRGHRNCAMGDEINYWAEELRGWTEHIPGLISLFREIMIRSANRGPLTLRQYAESTRNHRRHHAFVFLVLIFLFLKFRFLLSFPSYSSLRSDCLFFFE
jgi:hypothetical protein